MSSRSGYGPEMIVSGLISCAIALVCVYLLSFVLPFPWSLASTMIATGIAAFSGAVASFVRGFKSGQDPAK